MRASVSRTRMSSERHSTASAPWPTCGKTIDVSSTSSMTNVRSRRRSAAAAITMASKSEAFASRVSMLPRSPPKVRSGLAHASWARRRTEPVPTRAPTGSPSRVEPTNASRGSSRSGTAPMTSPSGDSDGRSLAECTAKSARPSRTAACTSFTKTPWPPISQMATSVRRSPMVCTTTGSTGSAQGAATRSVWSRANALARVAARNIELEVEELAQGVGQALALRRAGGVLQADSGIVQELGEHAAGDGLDGLALLGVETCQPATLPIELGDTKGLDARPKGADRRCHLACRRAVDEPLALLVDDGAHLAHLTTSLRETCLDEGSDVIEIEEFHTRQLGNGRIDVAWHRHVDDQQQP